MSSVALASRMGVYKQLPSVRRIQLAAAGLALQAYMHKSLLEHMIRTVTRDGGQPVILVKQVRYDETPMRINVKDSNTSSKSGALVDAAATSTDIPKFLADFLKMESYDAVPAKLLQSEWRVSALFRMHSGEYVLVSFDVFTPVQALASTSAEAYVEALSRTEPDLGPCEKLYHCLRPSPLPCQRGRVVISGVLWHVP
eukprot:1178112-Pyramimonas_sp.AAC.1